ncbi:DMT family transporter [Fulvivirga sediminis]|uniref:DMT family transporter n=1 Tax=Fulvivirga sediminis TaxID=2803949 RepID=A0A937F792_9BACT|nr:DMT family transporter [Fulvivirga sediminis]MBL3655278.1 DMT family transporter [Fulvivirga sediminis]
MKASSKNLILLFVLASLWGPSFLFIKIAVKEMSPVHVATFRIFIAAIALNLFLQIAGTPFKKSLKFWRDITISGIFSLSLPFMLISWAETHIDSALASILNGLTPLFTIIMANFLIADDKMTKHKVIGTLLGFVGLLTLISPHFSSHMSSSFLGIIAVVLAAVSYGIGMVYSRMKLRNVPPLHAPAAQLLVASAYMLPLCISTVGLPHFRELSGSSISSILALALLGTAVAYVIFFKIIESASASYLSYVTYLIPIYGIALGVIFLKESISSESIIGALIILIGLMIANKTIKIPFKKKQLNNSSIKN